MKRHADEPFALIGVNSDSDREAVKGVLEQKGITWRSFWNGGSTNGPISRRWNVRGWPTVYVLDHEGRVRFKGVTGVALDRAVDRLLAEVAASQTQD